MVSRLILVRKKCQIDDEDITFVTESDGIPVWAIDIIDGVLRDKGSSAIYLTPGQRWTEADISRRRAAPKLKNLTTSSSSVSSPLNTSLFVKNNQILDKLPQSTSQDNNSNSFTTLEVFVAFLKYHPKSRGGYEELVAGNYSAQARRRVTQVTAVEALKVFGNYPTTKQKLKISKLLEHVTGVSCLAFFEPKSHKGYLIKDIENLRRHLPPSERRWVWNPKRKDNNEADLSLVEVQSLKEDCSSNALCGACLRQVLCCPFCDGQSAENLILEMKKLESLSSTQLNRPRLLLAAKRTFCYRRVKMDREHPKFASLVAEIPSFMDFPELILADFERLYPDAADKLFSMFHSELVPKLQKICSSSSSALARQLYMSTKDNDLNTIKALLYHLPSSGKYRLVSMEAFNQLIMLISPGQPLPNLSTKEYPQLIIQETVEGSNMSCWLTCDGKIIEAPRNSILEALDFLFKFYWVLGLKYNPGLSIFFQFLQYVVYNVWPGGKMERISGQVADLKRLLVL